MPQPDDLQPSRDKTRRPADPQMSGPRRGALTFSSGRIGLALILLFLLAASAVYILDPLRSAPARSETESASARTTPSEPVPHIEYFAEFLPRNSTLQDVLFRYGFGPADVHQLVEDARPVYDLNRVHAGNRFQIETVDGAFRSLRYQISDEEYLEARLENGAYVASLENYRLDVETAEVRGQIQTSLWDSLIGIGEREQLIVDLAEILQWDVDFTGVQSGDWFKLIVEKKYRDGRLIKYGRILALQFNSGGRDFFGFRFENPESGEPKYYNEKGEALRKAFLRAPFRFSPRISSGFSYSRFHPILKKRRPHLAVDYAAPYGEPVLASGSGTVVFAGWQGGYGRFVKIKHPNGFRTSYAHLSKVLVKAGQKVQQGQRIGKVGATGLATAAHLDYRVQNARGKYLNPRKQIAMPSDKPVDKRHWSQFVAVRDAFSSQLAAIPDPSSISRAD